MSQSIIKEIFYASVEGKEGVPLSEEYANAKEASALAIEAFSKTLNEEQRRQFDDVLELLFNRISEYAADHYVAGFKFASALWDEAHSNNKD